MFNFVDNYARHFVHSPIKTKIVRALYTTPNLLKRSVEVEAVGDSVCNQLREKGVAKIEGRYNEVAEHILQHYFCGNKVKQETALEDMYEKTKTRYDRMGMTAASKISFKDPRLASLLMDAELLGGLYNYYQRQPFYRNQPVLFCSAIEQSQLDQYGIDIQGKFHLDHLHQVTFMLLLNDIDSEDTHLQYAVGSNKDRHPNYDRNHYTDEEIQRRYPIIDCVGKKGTLYVFDAGNGYHRAFYRAGTVRKVLHVNLTSGYSLRGDRFDQWRPGELSDYSKHVQKAFDKVAG